MRQPEQNEGLKLMWIFFLCFHFSIANIRNYQWRRTVVFFSTWLLKRSLAWFWWIDWYERQLKVDSLAHIADFASIELDKIPKSYQTSTVPWWPLCIEMFIGTNNATTSSFHSYKNNTYIMWDMKAYPHSTSAELISSTDLFQCGKHLSYWITAGILICMTSSGSMQQICLRNWYKKLNILTKLKYKLLDWRCKKRLWT